MSRSNTLLKVKVRWTEVSFLIVGIVLSDRRWWAERLMRHFKYRLSLGEDVELAVEGLFGVIYEPSLAAWFCLGRRSSQQMSAGRNFCLHLQRELLPEEASFEHLLCGCFTPAVIATLAFGRRLGLVKP